MVSETRCSREGGRLALWRASCRQAEESDMNPSSWQRLQSNSLPNSFFRMSVNIQV